MAGALVNAARSHQTALHMAAMKQHDAVVRLLVDFGADVYYENKSGLRPSALVPDHHPLYQFLHHCESTRQNLTRSVYYYYCCISASVKSTMVSVSYTHLTLPTNREV